ncbi:hypothetical protein C1646_757533, partial [Rhizophagus diaphanus]
MSFSLNCLLLGDTSFEKIFQVTVPDYIIADGANIPIRDAQIGQFKSHILSNKKSKFSIDDPDDMNLWKVEINTDDESKVKDVFTVEDIKRKHEELKAKFMKPVDLIDDYFSVRPSGKHVHIIIAVPTSTVGPSQQGVTQLYPFKTIEEVMNSNYLFLMGTSGSGKTRSLFELLCRTFGIYLSLRAGNGSRNLGSQDMDISISDLGQYLTVNDPDKNTLIALRFTRAMLLGRLFILNKLLDFHNQDVNRNFTPKQWLLMQLLPTRITEIEDFWTTISYVFRELKQEDQYKLINTLTANFNTLTSQEKLPIVIDESQVAIDTYKEHFSTTQTEGQLRPFFSILLRAVLKLNTGNFLCLSGGITFKEFFSIHDGFYECNEMSEFIRRFLPLNDELIRATFNIFQ